MPQEQGRPFVRVLVLCALSTAMVVLLVEGMAGLPLSDLVFQLVAPAYLIPGAVLVLRRGDNPIGWLLAISGLLWALQFSTETASVGVQWLPFEWMIWLGSWVAYGQWASVIAVLVLFPEGLTDRTDRQRIFGRVVIGVPVAVTVASAMSRQVAVDGASGLTPNPTGFGVLPTAVGEWGILVVAAALLAAVGGLWRRSRGLHGAARRQYTWVLFAFAVVAVGLAVGLSLASVIGDVAWMIIVVGWFLVPTSFTVAILRYRLYDIDRIVSRTVSYAVVTAIVAGVYVVPVLVLPAVFDLEGTVTVAAATLLAAAAFSVARRGVQDWVDRRFNRAAFDARQELEAFAARLRSAVDTANVADDIRAVVDHTLQPAGSTLWIRPVRRT